MKRLFLSVLVGIALAGGMVAAQQPPAPSRPVVLQRVLVKVNGAIFTKTELEEAQIQALQERSQRNLSPLDVQSDEKLRALLVEITPEILGAVVDNLIILQRGRELGYRMSEDQFKSAIENIKKENQLDDATFQAALKQQGLTMEVLRKQLEESYLKQAVSQNEVMSRLQITEEEARQYYRAHPDEFMTPSLMTLREIFISVPTEVRDGQEVFNAAADEAAQAKIASIRERAVKGDDFATMVTEFSEAASKANGGLIGPINLAELADALRKRLEPLKAGDVDLPIRTPKGYQLLKVETKSVAAPEAFEKVRNDIGNKVAQERGQALMAKYLEGMRAQAIIEWKDEELKKLYEQHLATLKKTN